MKGHYGLLHYVLRLLAGATAALLALLAVFSPAYDLLVRLGVEAYTAKWILGSPLVIGALWIFECLVMREDSRERKALLIDLGIWATWSVVCMSLLIYGLTHHFGFL